MTDNYDILIRGFDKRVWKFVHVELLIVDGHNQEAG